MAKDFVNREIKVGDFIAVGTRMGNSGGMYGATVIEIENVPENLNFYDRETKTWGKRIVQVPYVTLKLSSNGRKQRQELAHIAGRCVVVEPLPEEE